MDTKWIQTIKKGYLQHSLIYIPFLFIYICTCVVILLKTSECYAYSW